MPAITSTRQHKPAYCRKSSKLLTVSGSPAKLRAMGSLGASPTTTDDGPGPPEARGAGVWLEERPLAQGSTTRRPAGVGSKTRAPAPGLAHMPTGQEAVGPNIDNSGARQKAESLADLLPPARRRQQGPASNVRRFVEQPSFGSFRIFGLAHEIHLAGRQSRADGRSRTNLVIRRPRQRSEYATGDNLRYALNRRLFSVACWRCGLV